MTTAQLSKAQWLDRATMEVARRIPGLSPADASAAGEHLWEEARDLTPEEAAEIYAEELPPLDAGAPGNS